MSEAITKDEIEYEDCEVTVEGESVEATKGTYEEELPDGVRVRLEYEDGREAVGSAVRRRGEVILCEELNDPIKRLHYLVLGATVDGRRGTVPRLRMTQHLTEGYTEVTSPDHAEGAVRRCEFFRRDDESEGN